MFDSHWVNSTRTLIITASINGDDGSSKGGTRLLCDPRYACHANYEHWLWPRSHVCIVSPSTSVFGSQNGCDVPTKQRILYVRN